MLRTFLQKVLFNRCFKYLFNTIDEKDILHIVGDTVFYKGKKLDKEKLLGLKTEADRLKNSAMWKLLNDEVKNECNKLIFKASLKIEDARFGKAGLYILEIMNKKLDQLSKM